MLNSKQTNQILFNEDIMDKTLNSSSNAQSKNNNISEISQISPTNNDNDLENSNVTLYNKKDDPNSSVNATTDINLYTVNISTPLESKMTTPYIKILEPISEIKTEDLLDFNIGFIHRPDYPMNYTTV